MSKYDFVVVGGGTAGLVVAARLSENPDFDIVVLEAGEDQSSDPRVSTPALWPSLLGSNMDWGFVSVPQKGLNGKRVPLSQGRLLGGSSAINGQAFVATSKVGHDTWAKLGNPGWDWETMLAYYRKFHTLTKPSEKVKNHFHLDYINESVIGVDGPIKASFAEDIKDPLPRAWVESLNSLGYSISADPFTGQASGAYINAMSIDAKTKKRSHAANAYLAPVEHRKNLKVITGALARKILIDASTMTAVGVEYEHNSETETIMASKEVILAAGALASPKLLELSGIGSAEILASFGIPVLVDNPSVGENLQDHPNAGVSYEVADGVETQDNLARQDPVAIDAAMEQYYHFAAGPFATGGNFAGALLPLHEFEFSYADLQSPGLFGTSHKEYIQSLLQSPDEATGGFFTYPAKGNFTPEGSVTNIMSSVKDTGNFFTMCACLLQPLSRGSVHIQSSDPKAPVVADPNYLGNPLDLEVLARHVSYIDTIAQSEPFQSYLKKGGKRSDGAPMDFKDLDVMRSYVKKAVLSCYHLTSSCAMLPLSLGGVVDPKLKVYGVKGIRVVDASVFPIVPRGNSQTVVYAVAERAADIIKEDYSVT